MLGAAFAIAASSVPSYAAGFDNGNNVGGLVAAILAPVGGFGKFLLVLLALSVPSACAPTMYTFGKLCENHRDECGGKLNMAHLGMSFMAVAPFFAKIPRYVYIIISEAM